MSCSRLRARGRRRAGFTLIELMVVIAVIGIITSLGIVNFMKFRKRASYASCVTNQRHVLEASVLYISTNNPGTVTFDVDVLTAADFLSGEVAECPHSTIDDFNDYSIEITDNTTTAIGCKVEPAMHAWTLP